MAIPVLQQLANTLVLSSLLEKTRQLLGPYQWLAHWQQGEFHHDIVLQIVHESSQIPGRILVIATNCNAGVKEVLCFNEIPDRSALWHWRCPNVHEFSGSLPTLLDRAITPHWFDPCELLSPDARSELKLEYRQRQPGGGWELNSSSCIQSCKPNE